MNMFSFRSVFWATLTLLLAFPLGLAEAASARQANLEALSNPAAPTLGRMVRAESRGLVVEAPSAVDESGVVPVRVLAAPRGAKRVTLLWLGKTVVLPLVNARGATLLPAPAGKGGEGACVLEAREDGIVLSLPVRIRPVNWPVQNLSVAKDYVTPPKAMQERIAADRARTKDALSRASGEKFWSTPFVRPVSGGISSVFGGKRLFNNQPRSRHRGVDLRGANGTPIRSVAAGRVLMAEEQYFSGNMVYVDHGQGLLSLYCHMSRIDVHPGDVVRAGQVLGLVGSTGRVTGPHLHLGVRLRGEMVNPMSLFSLR